VRWLGLFVALSCLTACGPTVGADLDDSECDPWRRTCVVTIPATLEEDSLLELETTDVVPVEAGQDETAENGFLRMRLNENGILQLWRSVNGGFCVHSGRFSGVSDVPPEVCTSWCRGLYSPCGVGVFNFDDSGLEGSGFVADAGNGDVYRFRVRAFEEGDNEATMEYAGVR